MNKKAILYWQKAALEKSAVSSMVGVKEINEEDIKFNSSLIRRHNIKAKSALELGAGLGRVTYGNLYSICRKIDIIEQNRVLYEKCLSKDVKQKIKGYNQSIEDIDKIPFSFYDLIWIQWILEYVDDNSLEIIMAEIKKRLRKDGMVIVKENISSYDTYMIEEQGSLIRNEEFYEKCFIDNGFKVLEAEYVNYKYNCILPVKYWLLG